MIVLSKRRVVAAEALSEHFGFVNVVASGGVGVDFLIENKVGFLIQRGPSNAVRAVLDALLGVSPRLGSAVHKEREIGRIRSEADVVCDRRIGLAELSGFRFRVALHLDSFVVLNSAVADKYIRNRGADDDNKNQNYRQQNL